MPCLARHKHRVRTGAAATRLDAEHVVAVGGDVDLVNDLHGVRQLSRRAAAQPSPPHLLILRHLLNAQLLVLLANDLLLCSHVVQLDTELRGG